MCFEHGSWALAETSLLEAQRSSLWHMQPALGCQTDATIQEQQCTYLRLC